MAFSRGRGRPALTSLQLKRNGSRPSVWLARQRQEEAAANPATVQAVQRFISVIKNERAAFCAHRIDGLTVVPSDADPKIFTLVMDYASRMAASNQFPRVRRMAVRFIHDLETLAARGFYFDMQACENVQVWLDSLGVEESNYSDSDLFVLSNIVSWKRPDGSYRFNKHWAELSINQGKTVLAGLKILARI